MKTGAKKLLLRQPKLTIHELLDEDGDSFFLLSNGQPIVASYDITYIRERIRELGEDPHWVHIEGVSLPHEFNPYGLASADFD